MITVNAIGEACPIPVVKTKDAIRTLRQNDLVETLVDNEIAVQNLTKMANQKGYPVAWRKLSEGRYSVIMTIDNIGDSMGGDTPNGALNRSGSSGNDISSNAVLQESGSENCMVCAPDRKNSIVVVIDSDCMGQGDETLGRILLKGFIYAVAGQDNLPKTMLFYNGGAKMTTEGSPALEDLKGLEDRGVEILTCGTCLNHYGLTDKLQVGEVTNMYVIAEKMTNASLIVKP